MKPSLRNILVVVALAAAGTAQAANIPAVDVTVKKNGKAVSQVKTDANGSFTIGNLEPGAYSVELRSPRSVTLKGQQLSISITAGKQAPRQSEAKGEHLQSGVALNVEVEKSGKLIGQVSSQGRAAKKAVPAGMEEVKANIKVINGKRHVWVPGPIGSNMGGKWAEEGSDAAALSTSNKKGGDTEVLGEIQEQATNVGRR